VSDPAPARRRVRRGEGEVTDWPRGVASYVPAGPDDAVPDPSEDRLTNRWLLAGRLVGLLRARGEPVDALLAELRAAEAALRAGDRAAAAARVDRLLATLDALGTSSAPGGAARDRT